MNCFLAYYIKRNTEITLKLFEINNFKIKTQYLGHAKSFSTLKFHLKMLSQLVNFENLTVETQKNHWIFIGKNVFLQMKKQVEEHWEFNTKKHCVHHLWSSPQAKKYQNLNKYLSYWRFTSRKNLMIENYFFPAEYIPGQIKSILTWNNYFSRIFLFCELSVTKRT